MDGSREDATGKVFGTMVLVEFVPKSCGSCLFVEHYTSRYGVKMRFCGFPNADSSGQNVSKYEETRPQSCPLRQLVHCMNCKYGEVEDEDFPNQYNCNWYGGHWNDGEHFCSHAERQEE